jgi:type VI protein secretion system component Hcp
MTNALSAARIALAILLAALVAGIAGLAMRDATEAHAALGSGQRGFLKLIDQQNTRGGTNVMIDGGSNDNKHKKWIEILSYKTGFTALGGSGSSCRPLVVKAGFNPSWPVLAEYAADPDLDIDFGTLEITKNSGKAGPRPIRTYDFENLDLVDVDEEDDFETLTLTYTGLTYTVQAQNSSGTGTPIVSQISCLAP